MLKAGSPITCWHCASYVLICAPAPASKSTCIAQGPAASTGGGGRPGGMPGGGAIKGGTAGATDGCKGNVRGVAVSAFAAAACGCAFCVGPV